MTQETERKDANTDTIISEHLNRETGQLNFAPLRTQDDQGFEPKPTHNRKPDKDEAQPKHFEGLELFYEGIKTFLGYIGEDPDRDGLIETPYRVFRAWDQMTEGYAEDPAYILAKRFKQESEVPLPIMVKDIDFVSLCEHHLLPFIGVAHVAYIPSPVHKEVVGLSKIPRVVNCFARRLQIQERLTEQIGSTIQKELDANGVAVMIKATHFCMVCRGVEQANASMTTTYFTGSYLSPTWEENFFSMLKL